MPKVNNPNSQNDVVTTMTHVLLGFEDLCRLEMPGINCVYDEELSYLTALTAIFAGDNYHNNTGADPLPGLAYKRTILEDSELGIASRMKNSSGCIRVGTAPNQSILNYGSTYGEFEIQFLYLTKSIEMQEKFEVAYNSNEGISGTRELIVNMGEIGDFKYYLTYQPLTEKEIVHDGVFYKSIIGSVRVRGFYFTFRSSNAIIKQINSNIYVSAVRGDKTQLLSGTTIV